MLKKIIIAIAVIIVLLVGGIFYWATWTGSTKDIIAAADSLNIPSDWKLVSQTVEPPRNLCLSDNGGCPNLHRIYTATDIQNAKNALFSLLGSNHGSVQFDDLCGKLERATPIGEKYTDCSATQQRGNGLYFIVSIEREKTIKKPYAVTVSIDIEHRE